MNVKLVVSVMLVGGVLLFSGIKPSYLLDKGSDEWQAFSADFMALFNGDAEKRIAKETRGNTEDQVHKYYVADPSTMDEEVISIVNDVNRDLSEAEAERRSAITEQLKQRWKDQTISIEELKQRLKDQGMSIGELKQRLEENKKVSE